MTKRPQIISTRKLSPALLEKLECMDMNCTFHDFVHKQITMPALLEKDNIQQYIVLTSKNGVMAFLQIVNEWKLNLSDYKVFSISEATKKLALAAGMQLTASTANAVALADEILKHKDIKVLTHICSNRRRDELSEKLKKAGVTVHDLIAYCTEFTPLKITHNYDAILFFSPSAVDSFLSVNSMHQANCFCIGQTTANHAKQKGYQHTYIAATPSEDALVQELINHYAKTTAHAKE
jgi:uroporphyrinogen-III synthase